MTWSYALQRKIRDGTDRRYAAIAAVVSSVMLYTVIDAVIKVLSRHYNVIEITFFRNAFSLVVICVAIFAKGGLQSIKTRRLTEQLVRALLGTVAMVLFFYSVSLMPLANFVAISFSSPLLSVVFSSLFLKEKVRGGQWAAVLIGFAGVLIVAQPDAGTFDRNVVFPLSGSVAFAWYIILLKRLSTSESNLSMMFYLTVVATVVAGAAMPSVWTLPQEWDWLLLIGIGIVGSGALFLRNLAYTLGRVSDVAPLEYTNIIWASVFGIVLFDDELKSTIMLGATVTIGANLYLIRMSRLYNGELNSQSTS